MHELRADGGAIIAAGFVGVRTGGRFGWKWLGRIELTERIERGLQVSPAAEEVESGFAARGGLGGGLCLCWHLFSLLQFASSFYVKPLEFVLEGAPFG